MFCVPGATSNYLGSKVKKKPNLKTAQQSHLLSKLKENEY